MISIPVTRVASWSASRRWIDVGVGHEVQYGVHQYGDRLAEVQQARDVLVAEDAGWLTDVGE
jgi:hypothetical protein